MRIGLIIYGSIDTITGGYIYDRKLVDYLIAKGHIVKIFSQPKNHFVGSMVNNFSQALFDSILAFAPDILLEDEMNYLSLFMLNQKLRRLGSFPIISIVHLLNGRVKGNSHLHEKIEYHYLKSVSGFIFNSYSTQKSVEHLLGKTKNGLVAHPGKDRFDMPTTKHQLGQKCMSKEFRIIFIGNLIEGKGLHVLINALSKIDLELWQLSVIGGSHVDWKYSKRIYKMIKDFGLDGNVKVPGLLSIENLQSELSSHHVLAVPSYYESFGLVYAEAMGAGLPVIASKSGGASEFVIDKLNGFLIAPGDTSMITDSLLELINDRKLLEKMSLSSLETYAKLSSWDESMEKINAFLCQLIVAYI